MSSGERGKPAATYKEKNPFDISRRSETEIAAEIAQRMAAWKQARGRSYATTGAAASEAKHRPSEAKPGEAKPQANQPKQPHIAAPVQPARLPRLGEPVAHAPQSAGSGERIPLFAVRRAMPPAPSPKQPSPAPSPAPSSAPAASATAEPRIEKLTIDSLEIAAPLLETLIVEHPGTDAAKAAAEALRTQRPAADPVQAEAPITAPVAPRAAEVEAPMEARRPPAAALPEDREDRIETPPAPEIDAPALDMREGDDAPASTASLDLAQEQADASAAEEPAATAESASEPFEQERIEATRAAAPPMAAPAAGTNERATTTNEATEERKPAPDRSEARETDPRSGSLVARWEESVAAVSAVLRRPDRDADALVARRDEAVAPLAPAIAEAERDEHALAARRDDALTPAAPVTERTRKNEGALLDIEMPHLDAVAMEMRAAEIAMAAKPAKTGPQEREDPQFDVRQMREAEIAAPTPEQAGRKIPASEIAMPADLAAKATAATTPIRARTEALPRMETRIERRRIDSLRADPWIAGRRPVFPHIDPEVWDVPPPDVAARARRQGSGTGWAIGLGTLLLIAGITAPAALWQEPQQSPNDQDQVAALTPPAVAPQPDAQATPPSQPTGQQAAPQQATNEPPAPAVQAPSVETSSVPRPPASTSDSAEPAAGSPAPDDANSLSAIKNTDELNPAPVTAPPKIPATVAPRQMPSQTPSETLASRPKIDSGLSAEPVPDPMVPHPFVPDAAPRATPFRPEQAAGQPVGAAFGAAAGAAVVADSVSVPVAGAPVEGGPATISLKPSLSGQLKPTQTADGATARPVRQGVTRKPRPYYPQSLDQMFQNLIDTLGEGKPVNPATEPLPPGNRR
jgi:hypothetical protein